MQSALRIGIDGSCWGNLRGFGRFTRGLVGEMARRGSAHRLVMVIDQPTLAGADLPQGFEVVPVAVDRAPSVAASSSGRRSLRDLASMANAASRARCDVFYFPATFSYFPVIRTPTVVTVHDATAERLPDLILPNRLARAFWDLKQRVGVRRAAAVVTVSRAAQDEIVQWLGVPDDRLHVIREAPDPIFSPRSSEDRSAALRRFDVGEGDRYLLYVGGISPHKNLEVMVDAFGEVAGDHPGLRLLIVGEMDDDPFLSSTTSLRQAVEDSPARERITLTGYVGDDELVSLYSGAVATVLPSLGEGFGLTAAESAACGTPVVASDIAPLTELLGDAAVYAPPRSAPAFARSFRVLLDDPARRDDLAQKSLERAAGWSWSAAADTVLGLLEQAARRRR